MPYVKPDYRQELAKIFEGIDFYRFLPEEPGGLNYLLSILINAYVEKHGVNYAALNEVVGALEAAKLEFYRRIVVPYEDAKIEENGDMYSCLHQWRTRGAFKDD